MTEWESRLPAYPVHEVMFVLHWADVHCGHCHAGLHCLLRHGKKGFTLCSYQCHWGDYTPPNYSFYLALSTFWFYCVNFLCFMSKEYICPLYSFEMYVGVSYMESLLNGRKYSWCKRSVRATVCTHKTWHKVLMRFNGSWELQDKQWTLS